MTYAKLQWIPGLIIFALLAGCEPAQEPEAPEPEEVAETCRLSMGWDPWEPYHYSGAGGRVQGIDVDLVEAVASGAGCELEFLQGNWASLLRLLEAGELDLLVGATVTEERRAFARFTEPYREESFQLFVRVDETRRHQGKSLSELMEDGFRLGVTQGYIYGDEVGQLQADPNFQGQVIEAAVGELNFTHLLDYRIDGFLEDPFVFAAIQRRRGDSDAIGALDLEISSGPVHMMFSRASVDQDTVDAFNQSLEQLRQSGEYDEIIDRYLQ